jgi:hypothetical protein
MCKCFICTTTSTNPNPKQPDLQVCRKRDEKVVYVPDLAVQGTSKQVKGAVLVATTVVTLGRIWKQEDTEQAATR